MIIHRPGQRVSPTDPTIPACSWQAYQKGSYIAPAPSIRTRGRALGASHTANGIIKRAKDFRGTRTSLRRRRSLSQSLRTHPERAQILGGVPRPVAKINPGKAKYPDLDPAKGWAGSREGHPYRGETHALAGFQPATVVKHLPEPQRPPCMHLIIIAATTARSPVQPETRMQQPSWAGKKAQ